MEGKSMRRTLIPATILVSLSSWLRTISKSSFTALVLKKKESHGLIQKFF